MMHCHLKSACYLYTATLCDCSQREPQGFGEKPFSVPTRACKLHPSLLPPVQCERKGAPTMRKQNGFTLIEIAIVLVIIGLLLGGVLKGQELITSARVRNLISQQDGIKAAFFGFQDRFRA